MSGFSDTMHYCNEFRTRPTFQQAIKRVIGYFLTDLEFFDPTHKAELKEEDIISYRITFKGLVLYSMLDSITSPRLSPHDCEQIWNLFFTKSQPAQFI